MQHEEQCVDRAAGTGDIRKALMSGNQAIARGAYEAGVRVACAYPGTPSTEILEHIRAFEGIYVEWSPNEKVALEVALGAAIAGVRALAAMKHVGLNVAADPLFTAAYTGVNAGLVIVSADDPGMHSSQNEQDNRHYARFAKIPMLEPSDSQEAKDFVGLALDISERFDTPVMLRTTTRISHSSGIVVLGAPQAPRRLPYKKNPPKYVMVPGNARLRHIEVEARLKALAEFAEGFAYNTIEWNSTRVGIIASGVSYQYAREVLEKNASYLRLAMTNPIPEGVIRGFAAKVDRLYVIEELDPFLEEQLRAMGLNVVGKRLLPVTGELTPEAIRRAMIEEGVLAGAVAGAQVALVPPNENANAGAGNHEAGDAIALPARPPVMCPGCPHRGAFYVLRKLKVVATGDIGCYTLGVAPPLSALDTTICMGASIGNAIGFAAAAAMDQRPQTCAVETAAKAAEAEAEAEAGAGAGALATSAAAVPRKPVAVIGDSTFVHSGITGLIDAVYNQVSIVVLILDNGTTAMTGHQNHPATGVTLRGTATHRLSLEDLVRACGVEYVAVVDPYDLVATERALRQAAAVPGPAVVIARRSCVLLPGARPADRYIILEDRCTACKLCLSLGCPAIEVRDGRPVIIRGSCAGCGVCAQICRCDAIAQHKAGEYHE
ncbi:MAG: indolepyruvate ferredoxin oxidoreductase subunit alpha [Firmicutes bacterium]|nr:indolepyruvate ferredoxin oxidoreductase subunit alpha [Bacillota bacterium]